jgi:aspartate aminotransferase
MFAHLSPQPKDKILALMAAYKEDPRDTKVDLGVGVYKDASGNTPVMRAVKAAERRLVDEQTTKAYVGLAGDPAFSDAMIDLVLNGAVARERVAAVATPGGTGAIRQGLELIKLAAPNATVWISNPTWPNHPSIIKYLGMPMAEYRYLTKQRAAWISTVCWLIWGWSKPVMSCFCTAAVTTRRART